MGEIRDIIDAAMWRGRSYGHDDYGLDGLEDEWDADLDAFEEAALAVFNRPPVPAEKVIIEGTSLAQAAFEGRVAL